MDDAPFENGKYPTIKPFPSTNTPLFCRNVGSGRNVGTGLMPSCPVGETAETIIPKSQTISLNKYAAFFEKR